MNHYPVSSFARGSIDKRLTAIKMNSMDFIFLINSSPHLSGQFIEKKLTKNASNTKWEYPYQELLATCLIEFTPQPKTSNIVVVPLYLL